MITIIITDEAVGTARLYELRNKAGKTALIPSYRAVAKNTDSGAVFEFLVTRSASRLVFCEDKDRYSSLGECPPSRDDSPYQAFPSVTSKGSFCLRLYETPEPQENNVIRGQGTVDRTNILIHKGPSMSEGCFVIAGGAKGHRRFERWFRENANGDARITVTVLPYS